MPESPDKTLDLGFARSERTVSPGTDSRLHVIDLFCGAGGLAEGFRMAGFQTVLGVDYWAAAGETFRNNHPTADVIVGDIAALDDEELVNGSGIKPGSIGVLCGGGASFGQRLSGPGVIRFARPDAMVCPAASGL